MSKKKEEEKAPSSLKLPYATIEDIYGGTEMERKRKQSPIDKILEEEEEQLASEAKQLRLKSIIAERKKKLKELEGEEASMPSSPSGDAQGLVKALLTDPKAQKQWLDLTEDQRNVILSSIPAIMSGGGGSGGLGYYLPLMMLQSRANPTSTTKDMIELIKTVSPPQSGQGDAVKNVIDAFKAGIEVASKGKGEGGNAIKEAAEFLKPLYEALSQSNKDIFAERIRNLEGQIVSFPDQVKHYSEAMQALGYQRGGGSGEIRKLELDYDKWKGEQEWAHRRWEVEMGLAERREKDKTKMIADIIKPLTKKAAPMIDAAVEEGQVRLRGTRGDASTATPLKQKAFKCTGCGTVIPIEGSEWPDQVTCPQCGMVFGKQT